MSSSTDQGIGERVVEEKSPVVAPVADKATDVKEPEVGSSKKEIIKEKLKELYEEHVGGIVPEAVRQFEALQAENAKLKLEGTKLFNDNRTLATMMHEQNCMLSLMRGPPGAKDTALLDMRDRLRVLEAETKQIRMMYNRAMQENMELRQELSRITGYRPEQFISSSTLLPVAGHSRATQQQLHRQYMQMQAQDQQAQLHAQQQHAQQLHAPQQQQNVQQQQTQQQHAQQQHAQQHAQRHAHQLQAQQHAQRQHAQQQQQILLAQSQQKANSSPIQPQPQFSPNMSPTQGTMNGAPLDASIRRRSHTQASPEHQQILRAQQQESMALHGQLRQRPASASRPSSASRPRSQPQTPDLSSPSLHMPFPQSLSSDAVGSSRGVVISTPNPLHNQVTHSPGPYPSPPGTARFSPLGQVPIATHTVHRRATVPALPYIDTSIPAYRRPFSASVNPSPVSSVTNLSSAPMSAPVHAAGFPHREMGGVPSAATANQLVSDVIDLTLDSPVEVEENPRKRRRTEEQLVLGESASAGQLGAGPSPLAQGSENQSSSSMPPSSSVQSPSLSGQSAENSEQPSNMQQGGEDSMMVDEQPVQNEVQPSESVGEMSTAIASASVESAEPQRELTPEPALTLEQRLIRDSLEANFDEDEEDDSKVICRMCCARYKAQAMDKPPEPFVNAPEEVLVEHCKTEHPTGWQTLLNAVRKHLDEGDEDE